MRHLQVHLHLHLHLHRLALLIALALAAQTHAHAQAAQITPFKASPPLSFELKNAQWFDGQGFKRGTLYVERGVFTAAKPKRVNRRMNLKKQFLIAPLAEAHNYNLQNDWGVTHNAQRYLSDGVFYAAMLCGEPDGVDPVRERLNGPDSPDVLFVTACVTSTDGQPLGALLASAPGKKVADFADKAVLLIDRPDDVERKWPLIARRGTDAVKLVLSHTELPELHGRPEWVGRLGMTPDTAFALVAKAHKAGLRVIAHVDTAADFDAAVRAGADWIAHLPGTVNLLNEPAELFEKRFLIASGSAQLAARHKTAVITATASSALFMMTPATLTALRQVQVRNLQTLKAAGVALLLGSDVFTDTALIELRELAATQVFSPAELLKIATIDTPRALFPKRSLGCFEPGCEASFLLLATDPLQDLGRLTPLLRVKQGRLLTQAGDVADASEVALADIPKLGSKPAKQNKSKSKTSTRSKSKSKSPRKITAKTGQ